VSSQLAGRLYPRVGPRRMMVFGMFGAAATVSAFTLVDLSTSLWWIRALMFTRGAFMAFAFIPLQAATYATITPADTGRATAIFSTQRQVAAALGVATLATVLATSTQQHLASLGVASAVVVSAAEVSAFHEVFLAASLLALLGACVSLLVRDEDAARTMRPRRATVVSEETGETVVIA
jgi:MFS family permease